MPILKDSNFNIFTTYRSRAWNGTIGETEIKSAFGGFIEKSKYFTTGNLKNNLNIRIGTGRYESEKKEWNFFIGTKILINQDPGKIFTSIGKFLSGLKSKIAFSSFTLKE